MGIALNAFLRAIPTRPPCPDRQRPGRPGHRRRPPARAVRQAAQLRAAIEEFSSAQALSNGKRPRDRLVPACPVLRIRRPGHRHAAAREDKPGWRADAQGDLASQERSRTEPARPASGRVRDQASSGARATSSTLPHTPRPRPAKAPAAQNGTELPSVALPGLPNLGNTCYANAALKFVLSAYGPRAVQRAPTHRSCRPARPPRIGPSRTSWALWQPAPMRWSRICAGCFPHCRTLPNSRCSATRRPIGNTTRRTSRKG